VWQQTCQQLYFPRLKNDTVFHAALSSGLESRDFFGIAQGKEEDHYFGFVFGRRTSVFLDSSLLLIEPVTAASYAEVQRAAEQAARLQAGATTANTNNDEAPQSVEEQQTQPGIKGGNTAKAPKTQFYASIELDPIQAKKQFADLVDEVVLQFTSRPGVKVKVAIEIEAESAGGFDDGLQRSVKENCNVLRFKNAEFEDSQRPQ
jgi:hypothetical protein